MNIQSWLPTIQQARAIAVVRATHFEWGIVMAKAVAAGGMRLIEVTWNSDHAPELLVHLQQRLPHCIIGAGTLTTQAQVKEAIAVGAQFLFSPHVNPALIQIAVDQDIPLVAGALTPTEIVTAWQAGAASVKVFPVQAVGGAAYIRSLQGPLGHIPLIPTGGVTLTNAQAFLAAGAVAVGLSGELFPQAALQTHDASLITERATTLMHHLASLKAV